jgi:uncharacterized protein (DUF1800 family)
VPVTAEALVAHVLRRCSIAPNPVNVGRLVAGSTDPKSAANAAIDWALGAPALPILPASMPKDGWEANLRGWTDNLRNGGGGLHERMTWFWHGFMPVGSAKVGNLEMLHANQRMLRTHALGNFATLLRSLFSDPATMFYLDLAGSTVEAPNENFARELMELFTTGPGAYTEDDVKAGALALSGFEVNYETGAITRNPERTLGGEVVFLGQRGRLTPDSIIDAVLAQPSTGPHVIGRIYHHLVGVRPTDEERTRLGNAFRDGNWEIKPVVEQILRSETFLNARLNRPKFPIEWWVGALHALTPFRPDQEKDVNPWYLNDLNQSPNNPPNVAGWPISSRWLASDQQLARTAYVRSLSWRTTPLAVKAGSDMVSAVLERCSLYEVSDQTVSVLRDAALAVAGNADELTITRRLLCAALCSPEFALA